MAINDLFQLVLNGVHVSGQRANPTWYYRANDTNTGSNSALSLALGFEEDMVSEIVAVMENNWQWDSITVTNFDNPDDAEELAVINGEGTLMTGGLPPVLAVGFRSPKQATGVNRSHHQLPLLAAPDLANDGSIDQTAYDSLLDLSVAMGQPVVRNANGDSYLPIIVRKTYVDGVLQSVTERAVVTGQWTVNRWFTTQKSRQDLLWQTPTAP